MSRSDVNPGKAVGDNENETLGSVAEWSIAPVLKTGNGQPFVSSNLTASANALNKAHDFMGPVYFTVLVV